jgi:hypothetical protein
MRIPNAEHESRPWRIRAIAGDFTVEDVWALPVYGGPGDFDTVVETLATVSPAHSDSLPARVLWGVRDLLGRWFGLGRISAPADGTELKIPGTNETSLAARLPDDLRGTAAAVDFGSLPFVPLYRTEDEFAAEVSNQTVHGVLHLAWADRGGGRYQAQMAVYVKPRGAFGTAYMAAIKPFRYWVVYPALMRQIERTWKSRPSSQPGAPRPDASPAPRRPSASRSRGSS